MSPTRGRPPSLPSRSLQAARAASGANRYGTSAGMVASVVRLFQGDGVSPGAFTALEDTIESYTTAGGLIPTAQTRLDEQVLKIGARIDDFERRLAARREALQREFTAADLAMKQLNSSAGQLSSLGASYSSF